MRKYLLLTMAIAGALIAGAVTAGHVRQADLRKSTASITPRHHVSKV